MTKLFTTILFILSGLTITFGQEWGDTCDEAIDRANKDFGNGIMKATSYGLVIVADPEFEDFYNKYLLDKYDVITSNGGCVVTEGKDCYSSRMFTLIKQKYGQDFFEEVRTEAERIYPNKIKTFDDEEVDGLDIEVGPYVLVDVQPEFPGGLEQLYNYVETELSERKISYDSTASRSYVQFVIDSTGMVKDVDVVKGSNQEFNSAIIDIFRKMPKWTPGLKQNKKVDTKLIIPFNY